MASSVDWVSIRTEYETTNISQRKLADKRNVSYPTLRDRAKREGWVKSKEKTRDKIVTRTLQKNVTKIATKEADRNARHIFLLDRILDKAETVLENELTTYVDMFGNAHVGKVIDVAKLESMTRVLEKAQKGHRLALGLDKEGKKDTEVNVVFNIPRPPKWFIET